MSARTKLHQGENDAAEQQPWRCVACNTAVRRGMYDPCACTKRVERIRAALEHTGPCVSIPCHDRSPIRGEPMVARRVIPPMTLEDDDDAVRARWRDMGDVTTFEDAMRAVLADLGAST